MSNLENAIDLGRGIYDKSEIDTSLGAKADKNGNTSEIFKVSDAIANNDALNKGQLLAEIKAVDGTDSGLDADLLDGLNSTDFDRLKIVISNSGNNNDRYYKIASIDGYQNWQGRIEMIGGTNSYSSGAKQSGGTIYFEVGNSSNDDNNLDISGVLGSRYFLDFGIVRTDANGYKWDIYVKATTFVGLVISFTSGITAYRNAYDSTTTPDNFMSMYSKINTLWNSGNDGLGSGLDADLLRGLPADFSSSKAINGYQKLPSGLILQWGKTSPTAISSGGSLTITFPIAFPNGVLGQPIVSSNSRTSYMVSTGISGGTSSITKTDFTVRAESGADNGCAWIVMGY
jgi:hypothetical protein